MSLSSGLPDHLNQGQGVGGPEADVRAEMELAKPLEYPLTMCYRRLPAPYTELQIIVRDRNGQNLFFMQPDSAALGEIMVFAGAKALAGTVGHGNRQDQSQRRGQSAYRLQLEQRFLDLTDFSAHYRLLETVNGHDNVLGSVKRQGGNTLSRWKATYHIYSAGLLNNVADTQLAYSIQAERRVFDRVHYVYPAIATLSGSRGQLPAKAPVMRLVKRSLQADNARLDLLDATLTHAQANQIIISLMTMILLEGLLGNASLRISTGTAGHYKQTYGGLL